MSKVQAVTLGLSALSSRVELVTLGLSSPILTVVDLGPDIADVRPLSMVTITATWLGATPISWNWSATGAPVVLVPTDGQVTFEAPADPDGCTVTIWASADNGITVSAIDFCTVTVLPHLRWRITPNAGKARVDRQRIGV